MTQDTQKDADIDMFFPSEVTVEVAGEQFVLKAFTARHMRPYLKINRSISAKATQLGFEVGQEYVKAKAAAEAQGLEPPLEPTIESFPIDLLYENCYEEYVELVKIATGKPLEWVEELGIDELVTLASIINELNNQRYSKKPPTLTVLATRQGQD